MSVFGICPHPQPQTSLNIHLPSIDHHQIDHHIPIMAPLPSNTLPAYFKPEPPTLSSGQTLSATLPSGDQTRLLNTAYTSMSIGELAGGLKFVTVTGRILALREQVLNSRLSTDVRLILHMTIGDETGVLIVSSSQYNSPRPSSYLEADVPSHQEPPKRALLTHVNRSS